MLATPARNGRLMQGLLGSGMDILRILVAAFRELRIQCFPAGRWDSPVRLLSASTRRSGTPAD